MWYFVVEGEATEEEALRQLERLRKRMAANDNH
jgi:hypothetical protein